MGSQVRILSPRPLILKLNSKTDRNTVSIRFAFRDILFCFHSNADFYVICFIIGSCFVQYPHVGILLKVALQFIAKFLPDFSISCKFGVPFCSASSFRDVTHRPIATVSSAFSMLSYLLLANS